MFTFQRDLLGNRLEGNFGATTNSMKTRKYEKYTHADLKNTLSKV